jgi:hypothetical protein
MRGLQTLFMLGLTVAVGFLFVFKNAPQDDEIQALRQEVADLRETVSYWERQPTAMPSPTPSPTINVLSEGQTGGFLSVPEVQSTPGAAVTLIATSAVPAPTIDPALQTNTDATMGQGGGSAGTSGGAGITGTTGARIVNVEASLEVSADGCALNPGTSFGSFDLIYGIVTVADIQAGNTISVQFTAPDGSLIYEDMFTVSVPGNFCRWYTVQPDSTGWVDGSYTIAYQINTDQPFTATYSIIGGGTGETTTE